MVGITIPKSNLQGRSRIVVLSFSPRYAQYYPSIPYTDGHYKRSLISADGQYIRAITGHWFSAETINIQLTLEQHLKHLASTNCDYGYLNSIWEVWKKDIVERIGGATNRVFIHYSKHDATHSRAIISNIEMFLGTDRIEKLSATDTFMLLCCAYIHDYGMAMRIDELYDILNDKNDEFRNYLINQKSRDGHSQSLDVIFDIHVKKNFKYGLMDIYKSIIDVMQEYIYADHYKNVKKIKKDFSAFFPNRINIRFVNNIVEICQMHGLNTEDILKLQPCSKGFFSDIYHPRFIAAMIRLGDLLDLDNGRFSMDFVVEVLSEINNIPEISKIHFWKHESITHFYIDPSRIEISANCSGKYRYEVAKLLNEWFLMLDKECNFLLKSWHEISPENFGASPRLAKSDILINGEKYMIGIYELRMQMSQRAIFKLLEGSNIYNNPFVGIREIIQNAIDANLLQLWKDVKIDYYDLLKKNKSISMTDLSPETFEKYKIVINVGISDDSTREKNKVYIEVLDNGIGILDQDLKYMACVGEDKERNPRIKKIMETMPGWLKPSGVFGIGLQSVFQMTDEVEFFSKLENRRYRRVVFKSHKIESKGSIEYEIMSDEDGQKEIKNTGTKLRIFINESVFTNDIFETYDIEFDKPSNISDAIFVEIKNRIIQECKKFNKNYFVITLNDRKSKQTHTFAERRYNRYIPYLSKIIMMMKDKSTTTDIEKNIFFTNKKIAYFNLEQNRISKIRICDCIRTDEDKVYIIPKQQGPLDYKLYYKFTKIAHFDAILTPLKKRNDKYIDPRVGLYAHTLDILDYPASKYIQIDRISLKENSLTVEDIEKDERYLFNEYCAFLCSLYEYDENEHTKAENDTHKGLMARNKISDTLLLSLVFIFSLYADKLILWKFLNLFSERLEGIKFKFGENEIAELSSFLTNNFTIFEILDKKKDHLPKLGSVCISTLKEYIYSPALVPKEIQYDRTDNVINYSMDLQQCMSSAKTLAVIMDEESSLKDLTALLKEDKSNKNNNWGGLCRKVFKPNANYHKIITSRKPTNFKMGNNFRNFIESTISTFILSPFSDSFSKKIEPTITSTDYEKSKQAFLREIKDDETFKKCVDYVFRFHYQNIYDSKKSTTEKANAYNEITTEYLRFISDSLNLFKDYLQEDIGSTSSQDRN